MTSLISRKMVKSHSGKYIKVLLLIFSLCSEVSFTFGNSPVTLTCYVSATDGSDLNKGNILHPFKTLKKAINAGYDTILLRSGDIFYENMTLDGKVVSKYGTGNNPMLCGVKIPHKGNWENGELSNGGWTPCKSNIWRVNLSLDNSRYHGLQTNGSSFFNNCGAIVNLRNNDINGCRKVPNYTEMVENFDFWQDCPVEDTGSAKPEDFDYLYLYYDENPNDYDFGLSMGTYAVSVKDGEVSNLDIKYWGFGILFKDNVRIFHCNIDGIGGHIQRGYSQWVLLGNGIESWITTPGRVNCIIENCCISRTFDCGATIQGANKQKSIRAENIVFRNNTFRNCCQSFEEFLRGPDDEDLYYNCIFENNLSIDAGIDTGFRYWDNRYKRCHFLSNSHLRNTNMIIRNNTAINGNYYCAGACDNLYRQAKWLDNTCHIKRGQDLLGNYGGTKDVVQVPVDKGSFKSLEEATDDAISRYRYLTGDQTTRFIILDN